MFNTTRIKAFQQNLICVISDPLKRKKQCSAKSNLHLRDEKIKDARFKLARSISKLKKKQSCSANGNLSRERSISEFQKIAQLLHNIQSLEEKERTQSTKQKEGQCALATKQEFSVQKQCSLRRMYAKEKQRDINRETMSAWRFFVTDAMENLKDLTCGVM